MATAAELLSNAVEEVLVIDSSLRTIIIPSSVTNLGVESDDETTRLKFQMPRYNDGIDLSDFVVRINYENANGEGDVYTATDVVTNDDTITFSWLVGRRAVMYKGTVKFIVCLKKFDAGIVIQEFNTTVTTLPVLEGLEVDLMAQPHVEYDALSAAAYEAILLALDSDLKGDPGYTPVYGEDYYTAAEREEFKAEVIHAVQGEYANAYKQTVSGSVIRVDDASPIEHTVGVKVSGKNLISYPYDSAALTADGQVTVAGVTYIDNKDGSISVSGTVDSGTFSNIMIKRTLDLDDGVQYYIGASPNMLLAYKDESGTMKYLKNQVFTWSKDYEFVQLYVQYSPDVVVDETLYPMLCVSDTVADYEPYIDPTTVTLTRCGKNLLPLNTFTYTPSTSTSTFVNGVLTVNGYIAAHRISATGLVGNRLTLSCNSTRTGEKGGGLAVEFKDASNNRISGAYHQNELSPRFSFTVPEGTTVIVVFFYASGNADTVGTATYKNIQLEIGEEVTEHQLYTSNTYTPSANGVVENIYSVSPTMTLYADTPDVTIEAEYSRDIQKAIDETVANVGVDLTDYVDNIANQAVALMDTKDQVVANTITKYVDENFVKKEDVDTEMSDESENPVQNKVIKAYVDNKFIYALKLSDYAFSVGALATDGSILSNHKAEYVNADLIPVSVGYIVKTTGDCKFLYAKFNSSGTFIQNSVSKYGNTEIEVDWDGYIRIGVSVTDTLNLNFDVTPYIDYILENINIHTGQGLLEDVEDLKETVNELKIYNNDIDNKFKLKETFNSYDFIISNVTTAGEIQYYDTTTLVNNILIPISAGQRIEATNGCTFTVVRYNEDGTFIDIPASLKKITEWLADFNGKIRLVIRKDGISDFTGQINEGVNNVFLYGSRLIGDAIYELEADVETLKKSNVKCDTEMSDTSESPVQNKVIKGYVDNNIKHDLNVNDYGFKAGRIDTTGKYLSSLGFTRLVNEDLIPVKEGYVFKITGDYLFNIAIFDESQTFRNDLGYSGFVFQSTTGKDFVIDWNGYARVQVALPDANEEVIGYEEDILKNLVIISTETIKEQVYKLTEKAKNGRCIFNFPYELNHLYVSNNYNDMEELEDKTPAGIHSALQTLCDSAEGYTSYEKIGEDTDGNPLYKYVLEPCMPYINCTYPAKPNSGTNIGEKIDAPTIIVISGIHGIERQNDYAVYNFIKNILQNRNEALDFIFNNIRLVFIPCLNPSGRIANDRYNSNGIDLNRAFPVTDSNRAQVPELQCVLDVVEQYNNTILFIDMHTHSDKDLMNYNITGSDEIKYTVSRIADGLSKSWIRKYPDLEFDTSGVDYNPYTKHWTYTANDRADMLVGHIRRTYEIPSVLFEAQHEPPTKNEKITVAFAYDMLINVVIAYCKSLS